MYYRTYRNRCALMPDLQEIVAPPAGMILVEYRLPRSHARCVIIDRVCSALIVLAGRYCVWPYVTGLDYSFA